MSDESPGLEAAKLTLARVDTYVGLANVKASLLLPTDAVLLGLLIDVGMPVSNRAWIVIWALGILSITASTACAVSVVWAFLGSGNRDGVYHSLLYFGSITSQTADTYRERVRALSENELEEDVARQVHILSGALASKYVRLNWSAALLLMGAAILALLHLAA